jgi:hypothetical protein
MVVRAGRTTGSHGRCRDDRIACGLTGCASLNHATFTRSPTLCVCNVGERGQEHRSGGNHEESRVNNGSHDCPFNLVKRNIGDSETQVCQITATFSRAQPTDPQYRTTSRRFCCEALFYRFL